MNTLIRKGEFMQALDIVKTAVKAIDSKKGENIEVIAISDEVEYKLDLLGAEPHHIEGRNTSWVCLDYNSVVIHIFHKQQRDFYSLERLWEDGEILDTAKLLED